MRNIEKRIKESQKIIAKNTRSDISMRELYAFIDTFNKTADEAGIDNALIETIGNCFLFGVAAGRRLEKSKHGSSIQA